MGKQTARLFDLLAFSLVVARMSALRVLILGDARSFHLERYVTEMRKQGVEADLASCEWDSTGAIPLGKAWRNPRWRYAGGRRDLARLVRDGAYDLVNPHFISGYGYMAASVLNKSVPLVMHAWGSDILIVPGKSIIHRWKTQSALKRAQLVIADSGYLADEVTALYSTAPTLVIPWGIESKYILPLLPRQLVPPLKLISPRRLETIYGIEALITDLKPLLENSTVTLTIPGFGSLRSHIDQFIESQQIPGITLYDRCERDALIALLREHDCYCSNAASDSSPVSLLEAMALGLFPIVRDHPGVRTWLEPNNGILIDRGCNSFADAVRSLITDSPDYHGVRERNQQRIISQAIFEKNISETIEHFRRVTSRR